MTTQAVPFTVFNINTGEIIRTGTCPPSMVSVQATEIDEAAIAEETQRTKHYIDLATGEPRDRLPMPYVLETLEGEIRLTGLPVPATVTVRAPYYQVIEVDDGELQLYVGLSGIYHLTLSAGVRYYKTDLVVEVP